MIYLQENCFLLFLFQFSIYKLQNKLISFFFSFQKPRMLCVFENANVSFERFFVDWKTIFDWNRFIVFSPNYKSASCMSPNFSNLF